MPYRYAVAGCKYAVVEQDEIYLDKSHGDDDDIHNSSSSEHSGSDVSFQEIKDLEYGIAATSDFKALGPESTVSLCCDSRKIQSWRIHMLAMPNCTKCSMREALLLIIAIALSLTFAFTALSHENPVCTTRECIVVAGQISDALDESISPCDDFYKFACGGWMKKNPLPSGHAKWDNFAIQKLAIDTTLKNILEHEVINDNEISSERKAKVFYKKCLDLPSINQHGVKPIKRLVEEVGGWSISGKKDWSSFDLNDLLNNLAVYGVAPFVNLVVGIDLKNVTTSIIKVEEGTMNLSKQKFYINKTLDDPILKAYIDYMTAVCVIFGGEEFHSRGLMEDIIRLEQKIAEIQMSAEQARQRDLYYNYITITELQEKSSTIRWKDRIVAIYSSAFPGEQLDSSTKLASSASKYLEKLPRIIRNTANETLNNYAIWQLVAQFARALGQDFIELRAKLSKQTSGSDSSCVERWRHCVGEVDSFFGFVLGKLFVENNFNNDSRNMAEEMVREIKDAFKRNLPQATWLDQQTEQKALEKVNAVKDMIGYPDDIFNQTKLDEDYFHLTVSMDVTYFDIQASLLKLLVARNMKSLKKPVDKDKWEMTPPTINAYYTPMKNSIVFPAGILQPPVYSKNYPQSFNFGGMGLVVGHELTHGFDDEGRRYGTSGNMEDWWREETGYEFEKKTKCMVEQYSNLQLNGHNANGNITLGENIADNGGIRLAYDAYLQWRKTGDPAKDPLLPSLNYSHEQLFFIASAQLWCSTSSKKYEELSLLNAHSPNEIRVLGFTINSVEFADAFGCPSDSRMNPFEKCRVW